MRLSDSITPSEFARSMLNDHCNGVNAPLSPPPTLTKKKKKRITM